MNILILSSSSRHFPLDIQAPLREAGLESNRLQSLNEFIASPLRREPFLAILEVGSTEDIDRALVAFEWAETVQPLAPARYLLLVGSKHISLREKGSRFRGVEIAQLPLPVKNLLFKVELQLKVLIGESKKTVEKKIDGFAAEFREVERTRVMVIRGLGPREGGWKNSGEAPQGRIRWRWIDDPPKKGRPEESFSWTAESKTAPVFNPEIDAWEVEDAQADLQCHRDGKEFFSAQKAGAGKVEAETAAASSPVPESVLERAPETSGEAEAKPASISIAGPAPAGEANNLVTAVEAVAEESPGSSAPRAEPKAGRAAVSFSREQPAGVSAIRPETPEDRPVAAPKAPGPAAASPPKTAAPLAAGKSPLASSDSPASGANTVAREAQTPRTNSTSSSERGEAQLNPGVHAGHEEKSSGSKAAPSVVAAAAEKRTEPFAPGSAEKTKASPSSLVNPAPTGPSPFAAPKSAPISSPAPAERQGPAPPIASKPSPSTKGTPPAALNPDHTPGSEAVAPREESFPKASASLPAARAPERESSSPAPARNATGSSEAALSPSEHRHSRRVRTDVIETSQERPAEPARDVTSEFPEKAREITGKIVIPIGPAGSDPQNLVRSSGEQISSEPKVASSTLRQADEGQPLKTRLFLTLSLEELQDQNSSWIPVEGYRIYLSARHRYYGLRELTDIFPLWIYEGELAPEFLDRQKAWKFYDRLPGSFGSADTLPGPVARYLVEMIGAKAEAKTEAAGKEEADTAHGAQGPEAKARYITGTRNAAGTAKPATKPRALSSAWFMELVSRLLGR
jgi:hypothetical protein